MSDIFESIKKIAIVIVAMVLVGVATVKLEDVCIDKKNLQAQKDALRKSSGGAVIMGLLGGYRSLIADLIWIKSYIYWEEKRLSDCLSSIDMAVNIDPQMRMFWTRGASIIAYDTPAWILSEQENRGKRITPEFEKSVKLRQAKRAVEFLNRGLGELGEDYELLMELAQLSINKLEDFKLAEGYYERAMNLPNLPTIHLMRNYADTLIMNGKLDKSLEVLQTLKKRLTEKDPIYQTISKQISELEKLIRLGAEGSKK